MPIICCNSYVRCESIDIFINSIHLLGTESTFVHWDSTRYLNKDCAYLHAYGSSVYLRTDDCEVPNVLYKQALCQHCKPLFLLLSCRLFIVVVISFALAIIVFIFRIVIIFLLLLFLLLVNTY